MYYCVIKVLLKRSFNFYFFVKNYFLQCTGYLGVVPTLYYLFRLPVFGFKLGCPTCVVVIDLLLMGMRRLLSCASETGRWTGTSRPSPSIDIRLSQPRNQNRKKLKSETRSRPEKSENDAPFLLFLASRPSVLSSFF